MGVRPEIIVMVGVIVSSKSDYKFKDVNIYPDLETILLGDIEKMRTYLVTKWS